MNYGGPIVLAILDGVGLAPDSPGNAVSRAKTPFLARAVSNYLHIAIDASGESVGLVPGQMGNSEVGHNTMGAGRAVKQGIARINEAFKSGEVFKSETWHKAIEKARNGGTLHFAGIFSDGGVHSHNQHLMLMIAEAVHEGVRKIRVHPVFDGRDTGPFTATKYVEDFEKFAARFAGADIKIADGGGRMVYTADRYGNDWRVVERGFNAMVKGEAKYYFKSCKEAFEILRRIEPNCQDQYLPGFVIVDEKDEPVGNVKKGDVVIYYDFRADRAIEITMAFTMWVFPYFDRGDFRPDEIYFAGMTEYNSSTHAPEHQLVGPLTIDKTLSQFLSENKVNQLACSETVKFGHVTYFFNGNSFKKYPGEEFVKIDSYKEPLETRPWMKTAEITDEVVKRMGDFKFVRFNFPGGDMVGHTADINATIVALEAIDLSLARIAEEVDKLGGMMIIVADHGNAEELLDADGKPKTAHTTNKVPCIFYDNTSNKGKYKLANVENPGIKNLASTIAVLMGLDNYPDEWDKPLIVV